MKSTGGEEKPYELDDIDRGVLASLGRDARNVTAQEIAECIGVSASTVRNRMANLEAAGVVEGYHPVLDYQRAGLTLRVQFVCTVPVARRASAAEALLSVDGVVAVRELLTSQRNLLIDVAVTDGPSLARISMALADNDVEIDRSDVVVAHHTQPIAPFEPEPS